MLIEKEVIAGVSTGCALYRPLQLLLHCNTALQEREIVSNTSEPKNISRVLKSKYECEMKGVRT